jgi:zinc transporter ZupT
MIYALLFLSVMVGYGIAILFSRIGVKHTSLYLAFSGAFLLSITVFELLPEVFANANKDLAIWVMIGILIQLFLEFFSKGAEHGHIHLHSRQKAFPWVLFISLSIHALMEGLPISDENHMLWAIVIHKIPVAIIISLFFIRSEYKRSTTLAFILLFALMTPLGTYLMHTVEFLQMNHMPLKALVIGIFLHVSTTILFESSKDHSFNLAKVSTILLAITLAYFI